MYNIVRKSQKEAVMEYGLISNINQYADNNQVLIQQIQPSNEIAKLSNGDEAKKIAKDNFLEGVDEANNVNKTSEASESKETREVTAQEVAQYQEVELTNLNFGYNSSSQDFYVKVDRGGTESQFPTDEMMKLKAYFLAEAKAELAAKLEN